MSNFGNMSFSFDDETVTLEIEDSSQENNSPSKDVNEPKDDKTPETEEGNEETPKEDKAAASLKEPELKTVEELLNTENASVKPLSDYLLELIKTDRELKNKIVGSQREIDICFEYISGEVEKGIEASKKKGVVSVMVSDSQVYEMALHFYLEDGRPEGFISKRDTDAKPATKKETTPTIRDKKSTKKGVKKNEEQFGLFSFL